MILTLMSIVTQPPRLRFTLEGEYEQFKFTEVMIDHLDIESKIIVAECNEAKLQVRRFGIPPLIGKICSCVRSTQTIWRANRYSFSFR